MRPFQQRTVAGMVPVSEHESFGLSYVSALNGARLSRALGVRNRLVGYGFLVDAAGRIRWRLGGAPTPGELASLVSCAHTLVAESAPARPPAR